MGDVDDPDGPDRRGAGDRGGGGCRRARSLLVALGGDNSLTVATALGVWGEQLPTAGLITLDAHYDLRDGESERLPGAAPHRGRPRRAPGRADRHRRLRQLAPSTPSRAFDHGITVVHRDELHRRPMSDVMAEALDIAGHAGGPIHVDLDVDVCDRSVAPGCPASVPGGISA